MHLAPDFVTLDHRARRTVIFYRHRGSEGEESLADLVHQTAMYYEDRLSGRGFGRVMLAGATQGPAGAAGADGPRHALEDRLARPRRGGGVQRSGDRSAIGSPDRRSCWTIWRRWSASWQGSPPHDAAHESIHAAVLQRAGGSGGPRSRRYRSSWSITIFNMTPAAGR